MSSLILKRALASRPSGEWSEDDYDVLADGIAFGHIMKAAAAPVGMPVMWTLAFGHHEDRTPTHGYAATREAAMAAFANCSAARPDFSTAGVASPRRGSAVVSTLAHHLRTGRAAAGQQVTR
jgi:hypothetical protein